MATTVPSAGLSDRRASTASGDIVQRLIDICNLWRWRAASRQKLITLDNHLLDDVGLNRSDAIAKARKPFWRA